MYGPTKSKNPMTYEKSKNYENSRPMKTQKTKTKSDLYYYNEAFLKEIYINFFF